MKGLHMQISLMLIMTIGVVITRAEVFSDCSLGYRDLPLEHEYEHPEDTVVPPYYSPGFWNSTTGIGAFDSKCPLRLYQESLDLDQDGQIDTLRIMRTFLDSAHIQTALWTLWGNPKKKILKQVFQEFQAEEIISDLSQVSLQGNRLFLLMNRMPYIKYAEGTGGNELTLRFQNQSWEIIGSDYQRTFLCNEFDGASNTGTNESTSYNLSTGTLVHKVEGVQCDPPLSKKECKKQLSQCEQAAEYDCNALRMSCQNNPIPKSYTQKTRFKKGALPLSLENLSRIGEP